MLWPRIDQKTCLKAVVSAGLEAVPLALAAVGDELRTDIAALEAELKRLGPANVVAVVTTTSCFAPRAADDIVAVRQSIIDSAEACGLVRAACLNMCKLTAEPQASFCCEMAPQWLCVVVTAFIGNCLR